MSRFDESKHPRGHHTNPGRFSEKSHSDPEVTIGATVDSVPPAVQSLLDMLPAGDPLREDPDRAARIAFASLVEPGNPVVGELVQLYGPAGAYEELVNGAWSGDDDAGDIGHVRTRLLDKGSAKNLFARSVQLTRQHGLDVITPEDASFPAQLRDLDDAAPVALWIKGDISVVADMSENVTVGGARANSAYGSFVTVELANEAAGDGKTIVSGGAYGVEGDSLKAGLAAQKPVAAVLASGLDRMYPAGHASLLERVGSPESGGVLISEMPPATQVTRARFLRRNKILAALSGTTVITEAGPRSGALSLAAEARVLGRRVCGYPGAVTSPTSMGVNTLIRDGHAELVTSYADITQNTPAR